MPNTTPSLLVFAGSTRQQSFNRKLAHATAAIARDAGASVTLLELSEFDIPLYNADLECTACGAHLANPHQPTCPTTEGQAQHADPIQQWQAPPLTEPHDPSIGPN